ncbi:type II toxin-antitoxin system ParD family antitoxin [Rhizobium sp. ZW T2_16]|uniref:ribbon-helix-helix domain-containing protein n=1 Tax=Rhizobium sp. ZW T2_16 TaxID=3378083 RepID=UPI003852402C
MQNAENVSISLTREQMQAIEERVKSGEFSTISEAVSDAVRVWLQQRLEEAERVDALRELERIASEGSWLISTEAGGTTSNTIEINYKDFDYTAR